VQQTLWQWLAGTELQLYLADPARGSIHSFGMAVDVTLVDAHGLELDMGTSFDDLTLLSHPQHEKKHVSEGLLSEQQVANRMLLRQAMLQSGFVGIPTEWWHFDFGDRAQVRQNYLRIE
jgi:D-alanyl-D-alanine dipeptidase